MARRHRGRLGGLGLACGLLFLSAANSCVPQEPTLSAPCVEGCDDSAALGAACKEAEDCATGAACNGGFPGGYCQGSCEEGAGVGAACGGQGEGRCVPSVQGPAACLSGCDVANPDSCARAQTACYPLEGASGGVCHLRCGLDADCGGGLGCDGRGICRAATASCDGLTNAGCPQGQACFLSAEGAAFCGLQGQAPAGAACGRVAGCVAGHWCIEGSCQRLCAVDDFGACGGIPQLCTPVVRGFRLGYCRR